MKKVWVPFLAASMLLAACSQDNEESQQEEDTVTPVEAEEVSEGDMTIEKEFYGRAMPETSYPVIPPTAGEVESLEVANGDEVEEGETLATILSAEGMGSIEVEAAGDGEVNTLNAQEGGMVSGSEPMATIVDLDSLKVELTITTEDRNLFEDKETAAVSFSTLEEEVEADIDYVSSVPNDTGLYPVELSFDNSDYDIKPGMTAVVNLPEDVVSGTLLVPTSAVVEEADETYVYLIQDNQAVKTPVTIVNTQSDLTAVEGELSEGDSVVVKGQLTLSDGGEVSIMKEEQ
ncbi:efflux RND transporter periplasmic adaptor subunit [Sediminibacillus massiliensis]|uniref:efflux RND transporter periplasmic adaptor subunit n=1 Tax=Sediminibacillus massiliensis TaxID=1926277 RepID=UPI00098853B5|nr:efflux RND transporter periplasmic adaptor subunit [Sediminibacillus massiliensis]